MNTEMSGAITLADLTALHKQIDTSYRPRGLWIMHETQRHWLAAQFHGWSDFAYIQRHFPTLAQYVTIGGCVQARLDSKEYLSLDHGAVQPKLWESTEACTCVHCAAL